MYNRKKFEAYNCTLRDECRLLRRQKNAVSFEEKYTIANVGRRTLGYRMG